MEEIDIQMHLVLKKEGEDGPDVKGGQLDALIVHASKVQKVTESGKCCLCVCVSAARRAGRREQRTNDKLIASRTHYHIYLFFLFP